jgi:(2S)-methylsuccinyl-CoA dehydrogenase
MSKSAGRPAAAPSNLLSLASEAADSAEGVLSEATANLRTRLSRDGHIDSEAVEREQHAAHGLAWLATYVSGVRQLTAYAARLADGARLGAAEEALIRIGLGEYLAQIFSGIPMSQTEILRLSALDISNERAASRMTPAVRELIASGTAPETRARFMALANAQDGAELTGPADLDDTLEAMRTAMRRFADERVTPHAHEWHLGNEYIPLEILNEMSGLGVFALTIPETYDGLGLGKESMCVVSEELSRAWIGVGSLGTRSEIAAELIQHGGTDAQKKEWLPKIASGEVLPTAVFTEPNTGSDLASLRTRAVREGNVYKIYGNKTWITHPVRADLMTLLVRTNPDEPGYRGLSMLLAPKPRGTDADPFPAPGMSGTEIEVIGYLRVCAHPDRGARHRRRALRARPRAALCARTHPVRKADSFVPARRRQDRAHGG